MPMIGNAGVARCAKAADSNAMTPQGHGFCMRCSTHAMNGINKAELGPGQRRMCRLLISALRGRPDCSSGSPFSKRPICREMCASDRRGETSPALCGVTVTIGCVQSGLSGGNGSCRKHVERRARERAFIERRSDIGVDLQLAASGIDQKRAAGGAVTLELAQAARDRECPRSSGVDGSSTISISVSPRNASRPAGPAKVSIPGHVLRRARSSPPP